MFEWQGRWYLLDYKSNHLGMSPADYSRPALERAMAEHRYDLQYQLYSLALHRLLTLRLPGYDFEQHFGGVFYLFLRGMPQGEFSIPAQAVSWCWGWMSCLETVIALAVCHQQN